ncbi:MAG: inorganic diphosphatase [Firmicutes bacterium]|nr:inorganic diphosphatase [Bacillota bacterium]
MDVDVVVEIPKFSVNKYEYDESRRMFVLDRVLYSSVHYPTDYGYIPGTLAEDGDPIDIMVVLAVPTFPGCLVRARVVGALLMEDEKGRDVKIISVAVRDPRNDELRELGHLGSHVRREIEDFFATYKSLEGKVTRVEGWRDREFAEKEIDDACARYAAHGKG